MATTVRTDQRNWVSEFCSATVIKPDDPVFLKSKGKPGTALHYNDSSALNNPAGTVYDHGTHVAHNESFMAKGQHAPVVIKGINTGQLDGDTGFVSYMKTVFIEQRHVVNHAVQGMVNAVWSALPAPVQQAMAGARAVAEKVKSINLGGGLGGAQTLNQALGFANSVFSVAKAVAVLALSKAPTAGRVLAGVGLVKQMGAALDGPASSLLPMAAQWAMPMSPAQLGQAASAFEAPAKALLALDEPVEIPDFDVPASNGANGQLNSNESVEAGMAALDPPTKCPCEQGNPVVIATGEKALSATDFDLPGLITMPWHRHYRSGDVRLGWNGQGWSAPLAVTLHLGAGGLIFHDAGGREVPLPQVPVGGEHFDVYEHFTVRHPSMNEWTLVTKGGLTRSFLRPRPEVCNLPLASLSDRNGNTITLKYPAPPEDPFAPWRPHTVVDSACRHLALRWTPQHLLHDVRWQPEPDGDWQTLAEYRYAVAGDGQADLIAHRNLMHATTRYAWQNHVLVGYTLPDGGEYRAEYDHYSSAGRVTQSWAVADDSGLRFDYLDKLRATRITDALGRSTLYEYDARRDIVATTGPDGSRNTAPRDANGNPRGGVDALGRPQGQTRFDARGNLLASVDASGAGTTIAYNALDLPTTVTDALDHAWLSAYDARGNLVSSTNPLGHSTRYEHDQRGLPVAIIDAHGGRKRLQWNAQGQMVAYTDCSGSTTQFAYDPFGRLLARRDALGHTTRYTWDALGRMLTLTEPGGESIHRYDWSAEGRLMAYSDPLGARTSRRYNLRGELVERTDALGHTIGYTYDALGRLVALRNENGVYTHFRHDAAGNLSDEIGFDGRHQRYCWNAVGELTHKIEVGGSDLGPGKVTRYERDALGRLTLQLAHPGGTDDGAPLPETLVTRFGYDALGRMTRADNEAALIGFVYDPLGQLLVESQTLAGLGDAPTVTRKLRHGYDTLGNRTRTELPDGRALNWLFYGSGHVHQVNLQEADGRVQVISDFERDALHREVGRTQGATRARFEYDLQGRLVRQVFGSSAGVALAYPIGKSNLTATQAAVVERTYEYNSAGWLIGKTDSIRDNLEYAYDPMGNILAVKSNFGLTLKSEVFHHDPAGNGIDFEGSSSAVKDNRVKAFDSLQLQYDPHGNVTRRSKGPHDHSLLYWDAEHRLTNADVLRNGARQSMRYKYDALGRRVLKDNAVGTTDFLWDGARLLHSKQQLKQAIFVYEHGSFVPLVTLQDDQVYWYCCDQIGTPQETLGAKGTVVWSAWQSVWGKLVNLDRQLRQLRNMPISAHNIQNEIGHTETDDGIGFVQPLRFQGQQWDRETGLHYNRFRYYDPELYRYISQDLIGLAGGSNLYSYARNPVQWIDPMGLAPDGRAGMQSNVDAILADGAGVRVGGIKVSLGKAEVKVAGGELKLGPGKANAAAEKMSTSKGTLLEVGKTCNVNEIAISPWSWKYWEKRIFGVGGGMTKGSSSIQGPGISVDPVCVEPIQAIKSSMAEGVDALLNNNGLAKDAVNPAAALNRREDAAGL